MRICMALYEEKKVRKRGEETEQKIGGKRGHSRGRSRQRN